MMHQAFAVDALDRPRSRSCTILGIQQSAGAGCNQLPVAALDHPRRRTCGGLLARFCVPVARRFLCGQVHGSSGATSCELFINVS